MSKTYVPLEVMEKMKCLACQKYLSVFPVHAKIDISGFSGSICGRCAVPEVGSYLRDEPFENIAQYLAFPCTHNGCEQILAPAIMEQHESCCVHRQYECPSKYYSKCDWKGALLGDSGKDLLIHFQEKHEELLLSSHSFELSFLKNIEDTMLLCKFEEIFVLKKEIGARRGVCICSVDHLRASETSKTYMYYLKFESSRSKDYFYRSPVKRTKPNDVTKVTLEFLKQCLHDPAEIVVTIEIIEEDTEENCSNSEVTSKHPDVQWEMLSELECPVCIEYMSPPIYQCLRGHSLCAGCTAHVRETAGICPVCRQPLGNTQNFSLERMSQLMVYPCRYHRKGCRYVAKAEEVGGHERECEYRPFDCPMREVVECAWKGECSEVIEHVKNNHDESIMKLSKMQVPLAIDESYEEIKLLSSFEELFIIHFQYRTVLEKFYWAVQLVGPASKSKNYKFEVDVMDGSGEKKRFYLMGNVSSLVPKKDILQTRGMYLVATLEQLEGFIQENISFRIEILKIYFS